MASTERNIVNDLARTAVVGGIAMGYAKLGQMAFKGPLPKLDPTPRDAGMLLAYLTAAMATIDMLVERGIIPDYIKKWMGFKKNNGFHSDDVGWGPCERLRLHRQ